MSVGFFMRIPTRRDRWVYRWRCCADWRYMRQTWLFGHGRLVEWWWNR